VKKAVIIFLVIIFLAGCEEGADISDQQKQVIRLGVNNFVFWRKHENGKFSGADVDVWREIARRNNLEIEYVFIPNFKHLRLALEEGSIDVFVSMVRTAEREEYMIFIEPPFRTKQKCVTYVRAGSGISIDTLEDMHGRKIALASPGSYGRFDNDPNINKQLHNWDTEKAFSKLLEGTVDAVHIIQWQAIRFFGDGQHGDEFELANFTYSEYHPCYMVMSKKSAFTGEWKGRLGRTIQEMIDDGTMKRIIDSYVPGWYESYTPGQFK
jgi:polar amino acid transport system substrate-binding protein